MKMNKFSPFLMIALLAAVVTTASAQYDDVYFDPDRDAPYTYSKGKRNARTVDNASSSAYDYTNAYDDSAYDFGRQSPTFEDEDYDYYYTSRIRRFNRPYYGFGFFDPIYVDMAYYDPFFTPGATVLIYDNFHSFSAFNSWRRWNRWNRFNTFASWGWAPYTPFYSTWGWNRWAAPGWNSWSNWDPWFGPSFANNFYVNNFYGVGGGYVSNIYCPPTWGSGFGYNTVNVINNNNANPNGTYYGPRNTSVTQTPRDNGRTRISALEMPREANPALDKSRTTAPAGVAPVRTRTTDTAAPSRMETVREQPTRTVVTPAPERSRTYDDGSRSVPARETTPSRTYDRSSNETPAPARSTPSRTYDTPRSTTPAPAPRRDNSPAPSRSYDTPSRSSSPAPSRSYDSPSRSSSPAPSRSYDAPRSYDSPSRSSSPSYAPSPSRSYDSGSSRSSGSSSAPSSGASRTRGN